MSLVRVPGVHNLHLLLCICASKMASLRLACVDISHCSLDSVWSKLFGQSPIHAPRRVKCAPSSSCLNQSVAQYETLCILRVVLCMHITLHVPRTDKNFTRFR